ncbi:sporulation protein [Chitinibacter bivalviorum]|uniref:Sporulation protein n=1 Tax=Chitinibacter bivalviorum TaxID=2739434 RepID=A0A7H9BKF3_9NEIS|nr:sporulation protein [Chitinibacter bivalviorum]QLG88969.1 sporulation protein [Chitinibacter bivalviorum]
MFKKLFASIGVGGATVDTVLDKASAFPGGVISGHVLIKGGSVDQAIEYVDLVLMTEAEQKMGDGEVRVAQPLAKFRVSGALTATAGLERRLPFSLTLPMETPVNNAQALASPAYPYTPHVKAAVWIHTDLAIAAAIDAKDRDYLDIHPLPQMQRLIAAMGTLGFAHTSTDVEIGTARVNDIYSSIGCYQEFEFRPMQGGFGRIQEVEITCIARPEGVHVLIEADRRFSRDSYSALLMDANWKNIDWESRLQQLLN